MENDKRHNISPCGINCSLCYAFQRKKNGCSGCNTDDTLKPRHCITCGIKQCETRKEKNIFFCYECGKYPCGRMRNLIKRYLSKYNIDIDRNFREIYKLGARRFEREDIARRSCPWCGKPFCMHKERCLYCGAENMFFPAVPQ